jgi:hypothetical protein
MRWRRLSAPITALALLGTTTAFTISTPQHAPTAVLRVASGTPGREVRFRGVVLVQGEPMRLVEQTTPWEFRSEGDLVLAAFEPQARGPFSGWS